MSYQKTITAARVHPWFDTQTYQPKFGVQVRVDGQWLHLAVGGKAGIFDTADQAQANADELMRQVAS